MALWRMLLQPYVAHHAEAVTLPECAGLQFPMLSVTSMFPVALPATTLLFS